eukprot:385430_1
MATVLVYAIQLFLFALNQCTASATKMQCQNSFNGKQLKEFTALTIKAGRIERSKPIGDSSVAATIEELELLPSMDELLNYSREKEFHLLHQLRTCPYIV